MSKDAAQAFLEALSSDAALARGLREAQVRATVEYGMRCGFAFTADELEAASDQSRFDDYAPLPDALLDAATGGAGWGTGDNITGMINYTGPR